MHEGLYQQTEINEQKQLSVWNTAPNAEILWSESQKRVFLIVACLWRRSQLCWKALWLTDTWSAWLIMLSDTVLLHVSLKEPVKLSPWRCEYNGKLLQLCPVLTYLRVSTNQWICSLDWLTAVCGAALSRWLEVTCCAESDVEKCDVCYCCFKLALKITIDVCFPLL